MSPYFSKIAQLLILLCGINALLKFPIFINKIQLFEIILGISLLILGLPQLKKIATQPDERRLWSFWTPIDSALVGLFALMMVNMMVHPTQHVIAYDAHDLYWGMVAQMGIGYIPFLIFFIWSFKKCIDTLLADSTTPKSLVLSFQSIGLFILLDMLGDVGALHFRHYWIVFGLVSEIYALSKNNLKISALENF